MNQKPKPEAPPMAVTVIDAPQAIEQVTRGEVEIQAMLAVRRPRHPEEALQRTLAEATATREIAAACFYSLRKGGNLIEGPSVRLAEIAGRRWGNLRAGSRIVDVGDTLVTAQGFAWDLETNFFCYQERQRRITDKHGRRYADDVIVSTANAAASIAFREAIIKAVGKTALDPIWERCREVAIGDQRSLGDRYQAAIAHFGKAGIDEDRVLAFLGKRKSEVTLDDLGKLIGVANAIRDGEISIDSAFPPLADPATAVPKPGTSKFGRKPANGATVAPAREDRPGSPETPPADPSPAQASVNPSGGEKAANADRFEDVGPGEWADDAEPEAPSAAELEAAGQRKLGGIGF